MDDGGLTRKASAPTCLDFVRNGNLEPPCSVPVSKSACRNFGTWAQYFTSRHLPGGFREWLGLVNQCQCFIYCDCDTSAQWPRSVLQLLWFKIRTLFIRFLQVNRYKKPTSKRPFAILTQPKLRCTAVDVPLSSSRYRFSMSGSNARSQQTGLEMALSKHGPPFTSFYQHFPCWESAVSVRPSTNRELEALSPRQLRFAPVSLTGSWAPTC